jgi:hypothetical protein
VDGLDVLPDAALAAAVAARDPEALEGLYRRHSVAVFGVARRVTGVAEHGEEVLQEVFLRGGAGGAGRPPRGGADRDHARRGRHGRRPRGRAAGRHRLPAGHGASAVPTGTPILSAALARA